MKKAILFLLIFSVGALLFAQQKYALVIGNARYSGISTLTNPVNDANDMETALRNLGFTVEKVLNGNLEQMEIAIVNLKRRLSGSPNSYGFFFYAGHGVQANGENYLIPVTADNIRNETHLRDRAVSLQFVLDSLSEADNELNMIVLDACRDNPFGWSRSGSRGLGVVSRAPSGSIVMYATGANSTAADGSGRNGLFTGHLLTNLRSQGLSVFEVFDRTMGDVLRVTNGSQHPELSLRFAGATNAYLGSRPAPSPTPAPSPSPQPSPSSSPSTTQQNTTSTDAVNTTVNNIISASANWREEVAGGNDTVRSGTTADLTFSRETIQNREVDVMIMQVSLSRGNTWRVGQFLLYTDEFVRRLRVANGIRFSVIGDGAAGWKVQVSTRDVTDNCFYEFPFTTRNGTVVQVNIPFSSLRQPSWGRRITFNKNNITRLVIQRYAGDEHRYSGTSTIRIFNFEIY